MIVQSILTDVIRIPACSLRESYATKVDASTRESIKRNGIQQPILVLQDGDKYDIIDGGRRLTIARDLHIPKMQCVIEQLPEGEERESYMAKLRLLLVENQQDPSPSERAEIYQRLMDNHGLTRKQLADMLGINPDTVGNYVEVQHYIPPVKRALDAGLLTMTAARVFRGITPSGQEMILRVHAKELQEPHRSNKLHEKIRQLYPPTKRPDIYKSPKDAAEKLARPKTKRITKHYSHDEKRDLIKDVSMQTAELENAKAEAKAIKAACIACAPVVNAILRNKSLHGLAEVTPEVLAEFKAYAETY